MQNGRFGSFLRVVHKAEAAITCYHTQLGALFNRAAGAIFQRDSESLSREKCVLLSK